MKVWKNSTIEDAIVVTEKDLKPIKHGTTNSCGKILCPDVVHDFTGFRREAIKEIMRDCGYGKKKKVRGEVFQVSWRNLRANRHHIRGISRSREGDECFWTSARWWGRRIEERVKKTSWHQITWQKSSEHSSLLWTSFMTWTLLGYGHWNWKKDCYHIEIL